VRTGARLFFGASMVAQAAALLRYVVLARILGPEELGLAAMLVLTAQFFESVTDAGADRYIVQDRDGDSPRTQGVVQLAMAVRGVLIAVALVLSAGVVSRLYDAPIIAGALQALAIVPLVTGVINLDLRRAQRQGDFRPESYATIFGELAGVAATATAALIARDHTSVIYGLLARALVTVSVSHFTAERSYRWATGDAEIRRFAAFATPLFVNGLFLFFGSQGDRLMVGGALGATALGQYSAILLLIYYPTSAVSRFVMGMHLPLVAAARDSPARSTETADRLAGQILLLAVAGAVGFTLAGPIFAPLLYGHQFGQPLLIFAALGVLQAARLLRFWPTTLALGAGRSKVVMANNVARMIALPAAYFANEYWHSLLAIIGGFVLGEIVAQIVALWLLNRSAPAAMVTGIRRTLMFALTSSILITCAAAFQYGARLPLATGSAIGAGVLILLAMQERRVLQEAWALVRNRLRRDR
jgi:O-antigen/teichoic acid export membrane protein